MEPMNAPCVKTTSINLMLGRQRVLLCCQATIELVRQRKSTVRQENLASVVRRNVMIAPTVDFKTFLDKPVAKDAQEEPATRAWVTRAATPCHQAPMSLLAVERKSVKWVMPAPVVVNQRSLAILAITQKRKVRFLALIVLLVNTQHHLRQVCAFHAIAMRINRMPTQLRASLFNLAIINRVLPQKSFVQPVKQAMVAMQHVKRVVRECIKVHPVAQHVVFAQQEDTR